MRSRPRRAWGLHSGRVMPCYGSCAPQLDATVQLDHQFGAGRDVHARPKPPAGGVRPASQGILAGTLPAGARLPPTRALAEELGVARQTVVLAYERLASEGYVRARTGSGTYVAPDLPDAAPGPGRAAADRGQFAVAARPAPRRRARLGRLARTGLGTLLAGGIPAPDLFPKEAWARCAARVLKIAAQRPHRLSAAAGTAGTARARSPRILPPRAACWPIPANIVVTAGTQQALRIAAELLLDPGDAAWVEDPGYIAGRGALLAAGATPVPVPATPRAWMSPPASSARPTRGWRWWRRRTPRRWAARCRSAGGWRCWTGRRGRTPGSWRTTAIRSSAGAAIRCRRSPRSIAPAG